MSRISFHCYLLGIFVILTTTTKYVVSQQLQCPLNLGQDSSPQPDLTYCTRFRPDACCQLGPETELQDNTERKVPPVYGNGGCYMNIRNFFCSWLCAPSQGEIMYVDRDINLPANNVTVYVDPVFAQDFYKSCLQVCLPFGGGKTVEQIYPDPKSFLEQFNSDNDKTYVADGTHPYLKYEIGMSPNNGSIDATIVTLVADESTGCPQESNSISLIRQQQNTLLFSFTISVSLLSFLFAMVCK